MLARHPTHLGLASGPDASPEDDGSPSRPPGHATSPPDSRHPALGDACRARAGHDAIAVPPDHQPHTRAARPAAVEAEHEAVGHRQGPYAEDDPRRPAVRYGEPRGDPGSLRRLPDHG